MDRERRPITTIIRCIGVGQTEEFPIEMLSSVRAVVSKVKQEQSRAGWEARVSVDQIHYTVLVTRYK